MNNSPGGAVGGTQQGFGGYGGGAGGAGGGTQGAPPAVCSPPCGPDEVCVKGYCMKVQGQGGFGLCDPPCPSGYRCQNKQCVPLDNQGGPGGGDCPPLNGVPRKWSPSRDNCIFDCPPGTGYEPGKGGCQPCPPGTSQSEAGRCLPGLNGEGGAGGGGGGGGGGYLGGPFPYNDYEKKLAGILENIGGTFEKFAGDFYGKAFPAYSQGINYFETMLGKGGRSAMQAATAPAAEQIAQSTQGATRAIQAGYGRGGTQDQALAEAQLEGAGATGRLTQGVQAGAAQALIGGGLGGAQTALGAEQGAAGVYSNLAGLAVSSRLTEEGMALSQDLGFAQIGLGYAGLDLQRDLGFAGLDYQYTALSEAQKQFEKYLSFQGQQAGAQRSADKGSGMGQIMGALAVAAIAASSEDYKEEIEEPLSGEKALERVVAADSARRSWKYKPEFDLLSKERFDNALVIEHAPSGYGLLADPAHPAGRILNVPVILGDLVASVANLAEREEPPPRRRKRRRRKHAKL